MHQLRELESRLDTPARSGSSNGGIATAEHAIVAAHVYGTNHLLVEMRHEETLPNLSAQFGRRARTNSEALISVSRSWRSAAAPTAEDHRRADSLSPAVGPHLIGLVCQR